MAYITIRRGDTLGALARTHRTTVAELMRLNPNIRDPNLIFTGERLRISGVAAPAVIRDPQGWTVTAPAAPAAPGAPGAAPAAPGGVPWVIPDWLLGREPVQLINPLPAEVVEWAERTGRTVPAAPGAAPAAPVAAGAAGVVTGAFNAITGFVERMGWSPRVLELLLIAGLLTALGRVLKLRVNI